MSFLIFFAGLAYRIAIIYIAAKLMQDKGHSPIAGALLGMFAGLLGLIIAAFWPRKRVDVPTYTTNSYERPRQIEKPKADQWMHDWSEPEQLLEPIIEGDEGEIEAEKSKRFCAYCESEVAKTAMYCSSCGRLLDVY